MQSPPEALKSPFPVGAEKGAWKTAVNCSADGLNQQGAFSGVVNAVTGSAGSGPDADALAAAPDPSGLPCRNSNNYPKTLKIEGGKPAFKHRKSREIIEGGVGQGYRVKVSVTEQDEGLDYDGRGWKLTDDGVTWEKMWGGITSAEAKRAFALRQNVEAFTDHYQHSACGFLTLTPLQGDMSPKEFGAAFNDMRKRDLKWLRSYVRVMEAQKRGAPHYHLVCATPFDLKPSAFDWDALFLAGAARKAGDMVTAREMTRRYALSAPDELRDIWAELREVCGRFGLGRSEFLPFRKEAGAIAHYVGKYLEGGLNYKNAEWKGCRRVEYDRKESKEWKRCGSSFAWVSEGAKAWRERVGELAAAVSAVDYSDLLRILGSKWAYHVRPAIMQEKDRDWRRLLGHIALTHGGTVERKPAFKGGGVVVAWWPALGEVEDLGDIQTIHGPCSSFSAE